MTRQDYLRPNSLQKHYFPMGSGRLVACCLLLSLALAAASAACGGGALKLRIPCGSQASRMRNDFQNPGGARLCAAPRRLPERRLRRRLPVTVVKAVQTEAEEKEELLLVLSNQQWTIHTTA